MNDLTPRISKARVAASLKTSLRTIYNYQNTAKDYVENFVDDYPTFQGEYLTHVGLTEYQVWVLREIKDWVTVYKSMRLFKSFIENDPTFQERFSKQTFERKFPLLEAA